jgi:ribosome-binding protein aMBF1 (putative translation factor)
MAFTKTEQQMAEPQPDANGHIPAAEAIQISIAREIIQRRRAASWSQAELAARAGVRLETVNRREGGKHSPTVRTVEKIDNALKAAGV